MESPDTMPSYDSDTASEERYVKNTFEKKSAYKLFRYTENYV